MRRKPQTSVRMTDQNGWTFDTLKQYLESVALSGDEALKAHISSQKESVAAALSALKEIMAEKDRAAEKSELRSREAIDKADSALTLRLESMNQFRNQITSERGSYMTRELHDAALRQVYALTDRNRDAIGERLSKDVFTTTLADWDKWRSTINSWKDGQVGRGEGVTSTGKVIMATLTALSLMIGMLGVGLNLFNSGDRSVKSLPITITNPVPVAAQSPIPVVPVASPQPK